MEEILKNIQGKILIVENEIIIKIINNSSDALDFIETRLNKNFCDEMPINIVSLFNRNKEKITSEFDFDFVNSEGTFWFNCKLSQISKNKYLLHFTDITTRRSEEENFRIIFDNAIMGIYKSTPEEGKHIYVNPELARIYGYDNKEDLLTNVQNITEQLYVNPERRNELLETLRQNGKSFGFESKLLNKDGREIWISENARAVKNKENEIVSIVGTVKDITERKLYEEQLRQAKEDWERTFDAIDSSIVILDKELKVRRLNRAAKIELNLKIDDPTGENCYDIFNCARENCIKCPASVTVDTQQPANLEIENARLGKTFFTTSSPIFDNEGKFSGVVYIAKDITEEKKLRQQAEYKLQQAVQADKLKSLGEVVAGVAHEINNPTGYIFYNLALLKENWELFKPVLEKYSLENNNDQNFKELIIENADILASVEKGAGRIKNVVGNLKDFARVNSAGQMKKISINEAVDNALTIIGANLRKSVSKIEINKENDIPAIFGHFQKLEQVFINLAMNAAQSIKQREKGRIEIRTRYIKRLNAVLLEVEDNGSGIKPETLDKLFEPFFTTRRDIGGTGLGLSISYEIIQEHKGLITVLTKEKQGTKFTVYLPITNEKIDLNPKIMCVDDSNKLRNELRISFLEDTDKFFAFVYEAAHVLTFLEDHPEVDVILINSKFGNYSHELLKKINKKYPLVEIILYSEDELIPDEIKNKLQFAHFLDLPVNVNNIREKLNSIIRLRI